MQARDKHLSGYEFEVVKNGNGENISVMLPKDLNLAISMGMIPGYSVVDKFGLNPLITSSTDPEDIWEGSRLYTYDADSTEPIISISSSLADTVPIKIEGLNALGEFVTQTITLTGVTRKALDVPLWRVFRMENEGTTGLTGTVFCYIGVTPPATVGDAQVRAIIDNGNNQTLMALYTIPKGKVGFLYRGELGVSLDANPANAQNIVKSYYQSRRYGKVFKIKKVITLMTAGSSNFVDKRSFPDIIPSLTDIKLQVATVSANVGVWGAFDILLVDEDKFSTEYLQTIGQPGY